MKLLLALKWWLLWTGFTVGATTYFGYLALKAEDPTMLLPGDTTHGHYQIEMDCSACHTPWRGVKQDACLSCHEEELNNSRDSHPESKFTDPGNAHLLTKIQADKCIACHREHDPKVTHPMGVSVPDNYCAFCHEDIAEERPSHQGYGHDTCATAGCHNFHDNRSLYEGFLVKHLDEPSILPQPKLPPRNQPRQLAPALTAADHDAPGQPDDKVIADWATTVHAVSGVNCTDCHGAGAEWAEIPKQESCNACHEDEVEGFGLGRHGMRIAAGMSPMTPALARLPMHKDALHKELSCNACHGAHGFDVQYAASEACMKCHADSHTAAYLDSSHHRLWQAELAGTGKPGSGVSCATCHMPRTATQRRGKLNVTVQHNQNDNLRPSDKMVRSVCMNCHGVGFALQSLADDNCAKLNFPAAPKRELETMAWIKARKILKRRPPQSSND